MGVTFCLAVLFLLPLRPVAAQVSREQRLTGGVVVKPCSISPPVTKPAWKTNKKKRDNTGDMSPDAAAGWLDAHSAALDVQRDIFAE